MIDTIMEAYLVRPSGNVGQVVLDPDGKVIAWTTDLRVAQVIARLLSENEGLLRRKEMKQ
jgi:hypothetical protein